MYIDLTENFPKGVNLHWNMSNLLIKVTFINL